MSEKTKLVCLGDSVATNYKLKVRSNTFSELLGRRLGLEADNYAKPGAGTGEILSSLYDNENTIQSVKDAKIILIVCGSNNVLVRGLIAMANAINLPMDWRMPGKVMEELAGNPIKALKMVAALNSKDAKASIMEGVDSYITDIPKLIDRIRELNDEAIVLVSTVYILSDVSRNVVYKVTTKSMAEVADALNNWVKNNLPQKGIIIADIAKELREYRGDKELSNLPENDFHLSDDGHIFVYRYMYDLLKEKHPELATTEDPTIIHERKRKKVVEDNTATEKDIDKQLEELIIKTVDREDLVYDKDKQFCQMGLITPEVFAICGAVEKTYFGGAEKIDLPQLNYPAYLKPSFFKAYIEGKERESILLHKDLLAHYSSPEEKAELERNDSISMQTIKKHIYNYLQDDMVKITDDSSYFGDLHMNCADWFNAMNPAEAELNMSFEAAKGPDYETVTLKQIADAAEKVRQSM